MKQETNINKDSLDYLSPTSKFLADASESEINILADIESIVANLQVRRSR